MMALKSEMINWLYIDVPTTQNTNQVNIMNRTTNRQLEANDLIRLVVR